MARRTWRRAAIVLAAIAVLAGAGLSAFDRWIDATRLPGLSPEVSVTVLDRRGLLLRAFTVADGRWRLPADLEVLDRGYLGQLLAYEDKRFHRHSGVDPWAILRAAGQAVRNRRIVSGGSTITMQLARLLEAAPTGDFGAKFRQIRLALALERRLDKQQILSLYLTLAPFGGNIEGVRAASLSYFGKEPRRLTPAEAALLVALPQAPEARRPDRHSGAARAARDRVLARMAGAGMLAPDEAAAARTEPVPTSRRPFPLLSPHLAERARRAAPGVSTHRLTISRPLQQQLEKLLRDRAGGFDRQISAALIVVDHQSGEVLAAIGSPDLFDAGRQGYIDMTLALRSPGSTLKPLIYGLAFEAGLAHPESLVDDRPTAFGNYVPQNFDKIFRGTVSVRSALQLSLNIPAVTALDAVGPARLLARMRRAGLTPRLPPGGREPGLAIGLGGLGLSLRDLVTLYAGIARGGTAVPLVERMDVPRDPAAPRQFLSAGAAWQVADILAGVPAPSTAAMNRVAYKTGTSYGHRDAWAIGFDGRHVVGVWIGRPDGASAPGIAGIDQAAPLLFEAFGRLGGDRVALSAPPPGVLTVSNAELPLPLRRLRQPAAGPLAAHSSPEIAFPPDGARVDLGLAAEMNRLHTAGLALKVRNGRPPFTWLVNGRPLGATPYERTASWRPDGPGFISISVIDALGNSDRVQVFLQ